MQADKTGIGNPGPKVSTGGQRWVPLEGGVSAQNLRFSRNFDTPHATGRGGPSTVVSMEKSASFPPLLRSCRKTIRSEKPTFRKCFRDICKRILLGLQLGKSDGKQALRSTDLHSLRSMKSIRPKQLAATDLISV